MYNLIINNLNSFYYAWRVGNIEIILFPRGVKFSIIYSKYLLELWWCPKATTIQGKYCSSFHPNIYQKICQYTYGYWTVTQPQDSDVNRDGSIHDACALGFSYSPVLTVAEVRVVPTTQTSKSNIYLKM